MNRFLSALAFVFGAMLGTAGAQSPQSAQQAPIPTALRSSTSIFISNAGADSGLFPSPFSGDPSRAYNEFYSELKANGQFHLVNDPGDADLVLELQLTAPNGPANGSKAYGAADPIPMFRLVVYDRKTRFVLWAFTQSIDIAFKQKTHDRNFDDALIAIVQQFESLTGKVQTGAH